MDDGCLQPDFNFKVDFEHGDDEGASGRKKVRKHGLTSIWDDGELDNFDSTECFRWHRPNDRDDLGKILPWTCVESGFKTGKCVTAIGSRSSGKVTAEPGDRSDSLIDAESNDDDVEESDFDNKLGAKVDVGILFESYDKGELDDEVGAVVIGVLKSLEEADNILNNRFIKSWL